MAAVARFGSADQDASPRRFEQIIGSSPALESVLEQVGAVDTGNAESIKVEGDRPRRLCRIEEGQWFFGVCQGLAAYSSIKVEWVRAIFVVLTIFTGGAAALIYLILMFALPLVHTHDEYVASLRTHSDAM